MARPNQIEPADRTKEYTDTDWATADVDLIADSPTHEDMARAIKIVEGSGTLVVDQKDADDEPMTVMIGDEEIVKLSKIKQATTGITRVRVYW